jgi:hypothetical protein
MAGRMPKPPRTDRYGDRLPKGARFRLGTLRLRNPAAARELALSPDGGLICASVHGQKLHFWNPETGEHRREIDYLRGGVPRASGPGERARTPVAVHGTSPHI